MSTGGGHNRTGKDIFDSQFEGADWLSGVDPMVLLVWNPFRSGPHIGTSEPMPASVNVVDMFQVLNHIPNKWNMFDKDELRSLQKIAEIIKKRPHVGPADDITDLRRIMFDAGAGVSKHKLWVAARTAGRNGDM
ncbi:hypothetical protein EDD17DRAFT_1751227 [Pisolithus thermaeus]|nr:hypothetical protein EV401DRAFT_2064143 [Pisolithus croceorrhizus]KAI6167833.1 hypothetical protein EDD17DRAFT_1751227 [Pisolithus thermaeus]